MWYSLEYHRLLCCLSFVISLNSWLYFYFREFFRVATVNTNLILQSVFVWRIRLLHGTDKTCIFRFENKFSAFFDLRKCQLWKIFQTALWFLFVFIVAHFRRNSGLFFIRLTSIIHLKLVLLFVHLKLLVILVWLHQIFGQMKFIDISMQCDVHGVHILYFINSFIEWVLWRTHWNVGN